MVCFNQFGDCEVDLLPALPDAWDCGSITGLCARGGFEVDIQWEAGRLKKAFVRSKLGNPLKLRYGFKYIEMDTGNRETYTFDGNLNTM